MAISASLANILAAGRARFNTRAAETRVRYPAFDGAAFGEFLQGPVDLLVLAVDAAAPERTPAVALAAYDMALELVGLALAGPGARQPLANRVWEDVLPDYARLVAAHPVEVMGMLTNAAVNIGKVDGARGGQWLHDLCRLAPRVATLEQLRAVGQVLAWRSGLSHLRAGAIAAADTLPPSLALAAIEGGESQGWPQVRDRLLADPWWTPGADAAPHPGTTIGRFTGFGGEFSEPPQVRARFDGFVVKSGAYYGYLVADAYGATLHAATPEDFETAMDAAARPDVLGNGSVSVGGREIVVDLPALDLPPETIAVARNAHTAALTSPFSHAIRLVPLQ